MLSWTPWILCSSLATALGANVKLNAPERVPASASKPVEHDFASFSLPFHFFPDYAGMFSTDLLLGQTKADLTRKQEPSESLFS